ncbi:PPOX class F420-dependent oxidoreductase [Actinokineospora sp. G85]|uniref:PPOX class F420-dependent oxidoreductase n=1 Tax=Actinokineospora sp. G85 TaxID=3406626 RepID=UPI003C76BEF6
MHTMTQAEWTTFANHGTRTGKLATTRKDGSPHIAPVWFLVDGHRLVFMTGADTLKGRNLRRDGRFALCVDLEEEPFAYVLFQAEARISDDLDEMLPWSTRIAARYMGSNRAEEFGKRNAAPGELLVFGQISKVVAHTGISD